MRYSKSCLLYADAGHSVKAMISKLQITNLRCLKSLALENLGRITLVSGESSTGKSSILEGILLLSALSSPDVFLKTSAIRGIAHPSLVPGILWEPLFYGLDASRKLEISCAGYDGSERTVSFQKDASFIVPAVVQQVSWQAETEIVPASCPSASYPLKVTYDDGSSKAEAHFFLQAGCLNTCWSTPLPQADCTVQYIGPGTAGHGSAIASKLGKIELAGNKDRVVGILQMLDPDIAGLSVLPAGRDACLYVKRKDKSLLPLSAMGTAVSRLLMITCAVLSSRGGIVLIDSIEDGFHYSFYERLWKILAETAEEAGTQIFATSQSYECLQEASFLAEDAGSAIPLFRYIRLGRENGEIVPHAFSSEAFRLAIESDMEIR